MEGQIGSFAFIAFLAFIGVFCAIAKQVCTHQEKAKAKQEENHCHFCGDGEFFQVDWDQVIDFEDTSSRKIEGTSMVEKLVVSRIVCPECGRKSKPWKRVIVVPAPRFNYNRHL